LKKKSHNELIEKHSKIQGNELIPLKLFPKLLEIAEKSICIVNNQFNEVGTGFLVKLILRNKEKPIFGLITNNHILDDFSLKNNKFFDIQINKTHYKIYINNLNFKFTSELLDVTFIQFTNDKLINNNKLKFLEWNNNDVKKKDIVNIIQYPKGEELCYSYGEIKYQYGFSYFHSGSTEPGASGSPLINNKLEVVGIHNSGIPSINMNIATKLSIVYNAINIFFNVNNICKIEKAMEVARTLSSEEEGELKNHGLEKTPLLNVYQCPYSSNSSFILLFYRTNHGWYWTFEKKDDIKFEDDLIKIYNWSLINPYLSIKENIKNFNGKLERRHIVIMTWLKLSELMYM